MQRRFAALRYFTPLAVEVFSADPIVRMRIAMLTPRAMNRPTRSNWRGSVSRIGVFQQPKVHAVVLGTSDKHNSF